VTSAQSISRGDITGIVLAGGKGRRMGGVDKGLVALGNRPLVAHVIERLAPQVGTVVINANQNIGHYRAFGYRVVPDAVGGFAGPLAGLHAGLNASATPFAMTAPCDSPFLPVDLVSRLGDVLVRDRAQLAVAKTFDQPHPVFALVDTTVLPHLAQFLQQGGRKIDAWYSTLAVVEVPFDDEADAFRNINTREELEASATPGTDPAR
jgi:molybdopterin-guanine dinucleotide biosynthesis protein A